MALDKAIRSGKEQETKAIMISIRPQWVKKILNGEKTIEIRKTKPSCDLPVKVYIYCTKGKELSRLNSKVVGEFILNKTECWRPKGRVWDNDIKKTCLTMPQLIAYADTNKKPKEHIYAWHIDNLRIYDEPKEFIEFYKQGTLNICKFQRPPQSWCYVEKMEE